MFRLQILENFIFHFKTSFKAWNLFLTIFPLECTSSSRVYGMYSRRNWDMKTKLTLRLLSTCASLIVKATVKMKWCLSPSKHPSKPPRSFPSYFPSVNPTISPSKIPSNLPSISLPTNAPSTDVPTSIPSDIMRNFCSINHNYMHKCLWDCF